MKLQCEVETVFTLAQTSGGSCKNKRSRAFLTVGKKAGRKHGMDELFLVVSTLKNVSGMSYQVCVYHSIGLIILCLGYILDQRQH